MTNKVLAVFGIVAYILAVSSSATDLDGNLRFPPALILMSATVGVIFIIMATIQLWKKSKGLSMFLLFSFILLCILLAFQEVVIPEYGSPIIILTNVAKVIHLIAFILAIIKLFKTNTVRQDA